MLVICFGVYEALINCNALLCIWIECFTFLFQKISQIISDLIRLPDKNMMERLLNKAEIFAGYINLQSANILHPRMNPWQHLCPTQSPEPTWWEDSGCTWRQIPAAPLVLCGSPTRSWWEDPRTLSCLLTVLPVMQWWIPGYTSAPPSYLSADMVRGLCMQMATNPCRTSTLERLPVKIMVGGLLFLFLIFCKNNWYN